MKIIKIIKRFFEPALNTKKQSFKLLFEGFYEYMWWDLIPIIAMPIFISHIQNKDISAIKSFALLIIALYVIIWIIHFYIRRWDIEARYSMEEYLIKKYFKNALLKDNSYIEKTGTGKIQKIISDGIGSWTELNWSVLYALIKTFLGIFTGLYIILSFGAKYIPYFILILIISTSLYYYFRKVVLVYDEKQNALDQELSKRYIRILMSRNEVLFANALENEENYVLDNNKKQISVLSKAAKYNFLSDLSASGIVALMPFVGVLFFVNSIELNDKNIGFLISFIYFCSRFISTIYNMVWNIKIFFEQYPKIKSFWTFMDDNKDFTHYDKGIDFVYTEGDIVFDNVDFSYDEKNIFENLNIRFEENKVTALIGKSGSGKTTIIKLLTGYMDIKGGNIFINNKNIKDINLKSLYSYIGYLTQEPMIFDGSIKENLLYSLSYKEKEKCTDAYLFEILNKAECDFISNLDQEIGEKGIRLSGGEKQRLAIAKIMIKDPKIIILDEPTSALDSFSEEAISRAFDTLFKNKTVIIIAHRLQTIKKADKIYVFENGKIAEEGDHHDLKEKEGIYKKMLDLQSGE